MGNLGLILVYVLLVFLLILSLPNSYILDVKVDKKVFKIFLRIVILCGAVIFEVSENGKKLTIFGINFRLKKYSKNELKKAITEYENKNIGIFRKLKLKFYKFELFIRKSLYLARKIATNVYEYRYKIQLLEKFIEFFQDIIDMLHPKKVVCTIEFGTGKPELTGKLMALLVSVNYRNKFLDIKPNFNESVLNVETKIKGSLSFMRLIIVSGKFLYSKPVRSLRKYVNRRDYAKKGKNKRQCG